MTAIDFTPSTIDRFLFEGPEVSTEITAGSETAVLSAQVMHHLADGLFPETIGLVVSVGGQVLEFTPEQALAVAPKFGAFGQQLATAATGAIEFRDGPTAVTDGTCARCDQDLDHGPADLPAPGVPGRRVCATGTGEIGEKACGVSDLQIAVARHVQEAGRSVAPDQAAEWQAALATALPLVDATAEALSAFVVKDETAWLAITNHMLAKLAERAPAPGGGQ